MVRRVSRRKRSGVKDSTKLLQQLEDLAYTVTDLVNTFIGNRRIAIRRAQIQDAVNRIRNIIQCY